MYITLLAFLTYQVPSLLIIFLSLFVLNVLLSFFCLKEYAEKKKEVGGNVAKVKFKLQEEFF